MIILYGFAYSNYYNIVKHVLLQKGLPFEERTVYPKSDALHAVNPIDKVPALTTDSGIHLSESSVLVDYLEDAYPQNPLYPQSPEARAQVRRLMKLAELYLELPARRLLPAVLGKLQADDTVKREVKATLRKSLKSLSALAVFSPFVAGDRLTMADIYLRYCLTMAKWVSTSQFEWNILTEVPGLADWDAMMAASDFSKRIDADLRSNTKDFMNYVASL